MNCDVSNIYDEIFKNNYCAYPRHLNAEITASPHFAHFIYREDTERLYYDGSGNGRTFTVYIFFDKNTYAIRKMECNCEILESDFDDFGVYRKQINGFLREFRAAFDPYVID